MCRMLIVEDCVPDFELILESIGTVFDVEWATTLKEAVDKLKARSPDVILLDVTLPDSKDFQHTIQEVKKHRNNAPIIVVSGDSDPKTIERGIEENADGWVTKNTMTSKGLLHEINSGIAKHRVCCKVREVIEHLKT